MAVTKNFISSLEDSNEWKLLELVTLGFEKSKLKDEYISNLDKGLNWGNILECALRHKILPMLAFTLLSNVHHFESMPALLIEHLQTVLDLNRYKNNILHAEAAKIVNSFNKRSINFVGTKGITLESTIYGNNGSRSLGDIDFMIKPQDVNIVVEVMRDLGYETGHYDWATYQLTPLKREERAVFQLNRDHLPHFLKPIKDAVIPCIYIDFASSLTWTRSPFEIPVSVALSEIDFQSIPGDSATMMPCFKPKFQFIFTVLHLFREAWVYREGWVSTINKGWEDDVTLGKFADVVRLWQSYEEAIIASSFTDTIEEYQLTAPVVWVLEHTDRTFKTNIVSTLGLKEKVSEDWLHSSGGSGGKLITWKGTMIDRLLCKNRQGLFIY